VRYTFSGDQPGTAVFTVAGFAVTGTSQLEIADVVANISAEPDYLSADGQSQSQLTVTLQRPDGSPLTVVTTR
jgi:putative methionine-R-sulfoxide reductase with GAF domain